MKSRILSISILCAILFFYLSFSLLISTATFTSIKPRSATVTRAIAEAVTGAGTGTATVYTNYFFQMNSVRFSKTSFVIGIISIASVRIISGTATLILFPEASS